MFIILLPQAKRTNEINKKKNWEKEEKNEKTIIFNCFRRSFYCFANQKMIQVQFKVDKKQKEDVFIYLKTLDKIMDFLCLKSTKNMQNQIKIVIELKPRSRN